MLAKKLQKNRINEIGHRRAHFDSFVIEIQPKMTEILVVSKKTAKNDFFEDNFRSIGDIETNFLPKLKRKDC